MIKTCKIVVLLGLSGLLAVGVSLWAQPSAKSAPLRPPQRVVREKPRRPAQTKSGPALQVEPPDLLLVEVLEALPGRPISGERLVRPDGTISLGFYGDVYVAGLTLPEVKERIVLHMRKYLNDEALGLVGGGCPDLPFIDEYTKDPRMLDPKESDRVFVDVTAYNSSMYYVEGEVYYPSRLNYTGNDRVLDVIHYVGGITPSADRSKIRLIRSFPKGSPVKVLPVDYEEITMGTDASTNYQILPNDRLVVPRQPDNPSQQPAQRVHPDQARLARMSAATSPPCRPATPTTSSLMPSAHSSGAKMALRESSTRLSSGSKAQKTANKGPSVGRRKAAGEAEKEPAVPRQGNPSMGEDAPSPPKPQY